MKIARREGLMDERRKKRLETKGWRFGTAQEFLGLSDEEAALVEARVLLRKAQRGGRRVP